MRISYSVFSILKYTSVISKRGMVRVPDRNSALYLPNVSVLAHNRITSAKINSGTALILKSRVPKVRKKDYLVASTIRTLRLRHGSFAPSPPNSCGQAFFRVQFSSISAPARRNSFDKGQYLATSSATRRRSSSSAAPSASTVRTIR